MKKIKTRESQREAWRRWAAANPDKAQANRNKWAKSAAGKAWLKENQKLKNLRRDVWRKKKRLEARKAKAGNDGTQRPGDAEATNATRATPPGSLK